MEAVTPPSNLGQERPCHACRTPNSSGNKFCVTCGTPLSPGAAPAAVALGLTVNIGRAAAAEPLAIASPDRPDFVRALTWPSQRPDAIERMWWLPLVHFLPVFNFIVMRGWRLDVVRRIARQDRQPLPDARDIGRFFADGMLLWGMTGLYFLPQAILLLIFGFQPLEVGLTVVFWLLQTFTGEAMGLGALIADIGLTALVSAILPMVYLVATYPLYRVAMVRYAVSGRIGAFFDVFTNLRIAGANFTAVITLFFFEFLAATLFGLLSGMVVSTFIGSIAVPLILFPALYWTTAYLFGNFGQHLLGNNSLRGEVVAA